MHRESECSDTEGVHAFIITALTDMFNIIYKQLDGNWLFRALRRGYFGSPDNTPK